MNRPESSRLLAAGISEMVVSNNPEDILITYSLGSCVGVTFYDPIHSVGGIVHCQLPISTSDPEKAKEKPCMFVDTGVVALLQKVLDMGADKNQLICKVAGGGSPLNDNGKFRIGERNYAVLKKVLWKNGILIKAERVGGSDAKTMYMDIKTGQTKLRLAGTEEVDL